MAAVGGLTPILGIIAQSLTVLGKLNSAILEGILSSLSEPADNFIYPSSGSSQSQGEATTVVPKSFIACVRQHHSAAPLEEKFGANGVKVLTNENVRGVELGDVVILGVEPNVYGEVLSQPGMREALPGKILVSIIGGVSTKMLANAIYGQSPLTEDEKENQQHCHIIRVLPNTAVAVRRSIALIIEEEKDQYPPSLLNPIASFFKRVGSVKMWPAKLGPAGATLAASSNAFFALVLEGAVDGAVKFGVDRKEALEMAAATMRGAAALVASGEEPSEVRRKVATPGGSTAVGLKVLEDGKVTEMMEEAVLKTVEKASGLR